MTTRLLRPPLPVVPCAFPDCGRPSKGWGLCQAHLTQMNRDDDVQPINSGRGRRRQPIDCPLCGAATWAKTSAHGTRHRDCTGGHRLAFGPGGEFLGERAISAPDQRPCDFPGCERPRKARFCMGHDKQRQRRGIDGMTPLMTRAEIGAELRRRHRELVP